jgi:transposase-like protein
VDTTYFGRALGYMIFRAQGTNLYYQQVESETVEWLCKGMDVLEDLGYTFKSITLDGRAGFVKYLKMRYPNTPLQYCQFHQKQTIRRYITNYPQTLCGVELKELMKDFLKYDYESFNAAYAALKQKWSEFLKERNENREYKHRRLRGALKSLKKNMSYLFTYKAFESLKIPNTTNSCDGYFTHFKKRVRRHCGLKKNRKIKLIEFIIKNS